jgi:hypothetical protein
MEFLAGMGAGWGTEEAAEAGVALWAASMTGDADFTRWLGRYMRQSVSRNEIVPLLMEIRARKVELDAALAELAAIDGADIVAGAELAEEAHEERLAHGAREG